jgi:uncharacterized protein (UPF0218 family)
VPDTLLGLPDDERHAFKDPLGPIYTDAEALLADAGRPVVAVGDVVTAHLRTAGHDPHVAVVDERTERAPVADDVRARLGEPDVTVANPPATLTRELLVALADAVAAPGPTTILVDGEGDHATVPAVRVAPDGAAVVYGQPGEGMVLGPVAEEARTTARRLFDLLAGDHDAALAALGLAG